MKYVPLSNSFALVSILAIIIFGFLTAGGNISPSWGFTLTFFGVICLVASFVSIKPTDEDLKELDRHAK